MVLASSLQKGQALLWTSARRLKRRARSSAKDRQRICAPVSALRSGSSARLKRRPLRGHNTLTPHRLGEAVTGTVPGAAALVQALHHSHHLRRRSEPLQNLSDQAVGHGTESIGQVDECDVGLGAILPGAVDGALDDEVIVCVYLTNHSTLVA